MADDGLLVEGRWRLEGRSSRSPSQPVEGHPVTILPRAQPDRAGAEVPVSSRWSHTVCAAQPANQRTPPALAR